MPTILYDASQKLQNSLLQEFHQTLMRAYKISVGDGYPQQLLRLYSTMFHEWSALQKDVSDVMDAVSSLDWSVAPWVEAGQKPTDQAREVADVVSSALWQTTPQEPGTFAHSFLDMVGATVDGIYRGISVHEIIWHRDASLVYPAEYCQVQPQHYVWETREEHKDRLLMVPDGYTYTNPKPFPEDKFIIALNTTGSDHPIYNAVFYSLISFFMAAKHGLPWMQEFCQRYGHPSRVFHVLNDEDEAKLRAQLMSSPDVYDIFLKEGRSVEITPIPGAQGNPHEVLLRVAENACHQAILGQTLTSDTSANGGSLAQAEVHMGVQKSIVLKRAEYVARVLNRQLIPAIVRMNYGRTYGIPMPELKFAAPDDGANVQRADYWAKVLMIPGMQVAKEVVYESMRLPIPGEGEAVLSTPDTSGMQQPMQQDPFAFLKKNSEAVAAANAEDEEEPEEDRPKQRRSLLNREALASTLSELFSESLLSRKEAKVEAAASDNEECRSKDPPHCRVHGTPLKKQEKSGQKKEGNTSLKKQEKSTQTKKGKKAKWTEERNAQYDLYLAHHKEKKKEFTDPIPQDEGIVFDLEHLNLQEIQVTRSTMGEMIGRKAVATSILNDCSVDAHYEAVSKYREVLASAKKGKATLPRKKVQYIKKIIPLSAPFVSSEGKHYVAKFKIHVPQSEKEKKRLYFMNLDKEKRKKPSPKLDGRTGSRT